MKRFIKTCLVAVSGEWTELKEKKKKKCHGHKFSGVEVLGFCSEGGKGNKIRSRKIKRRFFCSQPPPKRVFAGMFSLLINFVILCAPRERVRKKHEGGIKTRLAFKEHNFAGIKKSRKRGKKSK